ncbi:branched-chain amino acid transaminase [Actinomadura sp. B10D3]|uniref:branched-chain amino acid transaminase n=1 Tax=Actinomadura sp. B10D3 TaxID=3153557 RepID=UPI00325ED5D4
MKLNPTPYVWMDGELVPWPEAKVHVLTPSLHYGWAVYEGIRCYATPKGTAVFRLSTHLKRLRNSARVYLMDVKWSDAELANAVRALIQSNDLDSCYVRPIVYLGYGSMGVAPDLSSVRVSIAAWKWDSYLGAQAESGGCRLVTSAWRRNAPESVPATAKATGAYVNSSLAKVGALRAGYDDALMLSLHGHVAESSASNVFMVVDGVLVTPPISDGILPGITRNSVITLARDLGHRVEERSFGLSEIHVADEVFLTGTAMEIMPVVSVDDRPMTHGTDGPVSKSLIESFRSVVSGRSVQYREWLSFV